MSMQLGRRGVMAGMAIFATATHAMAQGKPVRLVVPYGPGGGPDVFARRLAQGLAARLGSPVVVDNRPGATTMLGTEYAAAAAPDGLTLLMGTSTTFAANPHLFRRINYSMAQFQPITLLIRTRLALYANLDLPANDMAGVIALAKAAPQPMHYGVTARGNSTHLTGEALKIAAGIDLQDVPYRSTGSMQQGVLRNDIPLAIDGIPAWLGLARERKVKVIGVTGDTRVGALPDTPTFAEAGLRDLGHQHWYGLLAPAGLPAAELARLHAATVATMQDAELWQNLTHEGATIETNTPEAFAALIAEETETWGQIIRRIGLTLD
ncbi:Bug family tripartite tricarboxylate transporter substrate binding protein [Humitalea sp. 24SJ18S-53]|uniref:Bug family tripartite tricarboxylate transporter substrate binding protein n=1 Tax=Humitalea sp. 24SJ18S-53 TaxID=3422307 RepID=UPI003D674CFF